MKLGEKIAAQRRKLGLSQEELASRLNVTRQAVSKWETGASVPELETLVALARIFGVTTDYLLSMEETPESQPQQTTPDLLEHLPGMLGKMFRRYGWLGGLYMAVSGLGITAMGFLIRYMVGRIFGGYGLLDASADPGLTEFIRSSPMYTMSSIVITIGTAMLLSGIVLSIWLRNKK